MYKHVFTTLTATVAGLALMAGPVSAGETAAALPCVGGELVLQTPAAESVLAVISADDLLQGLFGAVDEDGVVAQDWTSTVSLPDEDDVEAFAQGLLADVYDDPFLATYQPAYQAGTAADPATIPAPAPAVGDLLQGVLGPTMAVCVTSTGVVSTSPYGTSAVTTSPYGTGAVTTRPYGTGAVSTTPYGTGAVTTSGRSQSLLDTLGVNRLVDGIVSGLTP